MMPVEAAFGVIGTAMFISIVNYLNISLENLDEHEDVSLARFFIDDRGLKAFEMLVVAALIYAVAMIVTAIEFSTGSTLMLYTSRMMILIVIGIVVHAASQVAEVTEPASR